MSLKTSIIADIREYVAAHPDEASVWHWLLAACNDHLDITSRKHFAGHVTVGVILFDTATRKVLQVYHKALNRWLFPGGHLEPTDNTLLGAALRELREETSIDIAPPHISRIVDIDRHLIPENLSKGEPAHYHYDCRYLIVCDTAVDMILQVDEVIDHRWIELSEITPDRIIRKVSPYL